MKNRKPSLRAVQANPNADCAVVAQGTVGGLDKQSYKAIEAFVGEARLSRDDHYAPARVVEAQLQVIVLSATASTVVAALPGSASVEYPAWDSMCAAASSRLRTRW